MVRFTAAERDGEGTNHRSPLHAHPVPRSARGGLRRLRHQPALYAFRECFAVHHGMRVEPSQANVLGILSLICWSLVIVISVKYLAFVMRADNRGEGGILALMSLVRPKASKRHGVLIALGLFGSALLYGDGMITPAITVLGAAEGLEVATPLFTPYVVPITVVVLVVLFMFQKAGTARIGALFGLVMMLVHRARGARRHQHRAGAGCARSRGSGARHRVPHPPSTGRLLRPRCGVPGGDRRRSALRRHGTFRRAPDPAGMVRRRLSFAPAQLSRAGRASAARSGGDREPVLPHGAGLGALSTRCVVDDRCNHRLAGGHLRIVFTDAPGGAARISAAHPHPPYVGSGVEDRRPRLSGQAGRLSSTFRTT